MLTAHPIPGKKKSADLCAAFIKGAPASAEGHVFYGVDESNVAAWDAIRSRGEDWFYLDNSYFDAARGQQFRVTKNRVQHSGEGSSTGERFKALGLKIEPWVRRPGACRVLCVEQSPSFMRCVAKDEGWLAREAGVWPARWRPWNRDKTAAGGSLDAALRDPEIFGVLAHSSAALIESLLRGVPVVWCHHAHPAFSVAPWDSPDDRLRLFSVLADNQFTIDELQDGTAWHALHLGH